MSISYEDIYIYIFNWHKTTQNAINMYNIVTKYCKNCYIINCDENFKNNENYNCIQLDDNYYFGGQFETSIKDIPDNKFFCNIVADMDINIDWMKLFDNAIDAFNSYEIGVYSPYDINSGHQDRHELLDKCLYNITNTDCTCWFIHPNIIKKIKNIEYYNICNYGWGIDIMIMKESKKQNLLTIRDYSIEIVQPKNSSGYNHDIAIVQLNNLLNYYDNNL
jgi:hypothetical protein